MSIAFFPKASTGEGIIQNGGVNAIVIDSSQNVTIPQNLTVSGTLNSATGAVYPLVSGTAVPTTSGTAVVVPGIPATAKRVTVMINQVSTSGTTTPVIQLSAASTFVTSGYAGACGLVSSASNTTRGNTSTTGFALNTSGTWVATSSTSGVMTLVLLGSNIWLAAYNGSDTLGNTMNGSGQITLSGALDQIRIYAGGTDTFDAGSINIMWE